MASGFRKKALFTIVALAALACLAALAPALWLRVQTRWYVHELASTDAGQFQRAFQALAYDLSPEVAFLLCDEVDKHPPKDVHYQLARVLHVRAGVPYLWENWELMTGGELRRMIAASYRDREKPSRRP
jgi:hypothetical protein